MMAQDKPARADILLVEDNPCDVRLAKEALGMSGIQTTLAVVESGEEALDHLYKRNGHESASRPSLILLDVNLPGINGIDVLDAIKKDDKLKTIPVVILSTSRNDIDVALQKHANCYVVKPPNFLDFVRILRAIDSFWLGTTELSKHVGSVR